MKLYFAGSTAFQPALENSVNTKSHHILPNSEFHNEP